MYYVKNLYSWERWLRIAIFALVSIAPLFFELPMPVLWPIIGVSMIITGLMGWCPMCAMVGRKIGEKQS